MFVRAGQICFVDVVERSDETLQSAQNFRAATWRRRLAMTLSMTSAFSVIPAITKTAALRS